MSSDVAELEIPPCLEARARVFEVMYRNAWPPMREALYILERAEAGYSERSMDNHEEWCARRAQIERQDAQRAIVGKFKRGDVRICARFLWMDKNFLLRDGIQPHLYETEVVVGKEVERTYQSTYAQASAAFRAKVAEIL